jgi:Phosphotransferase enzyme family
MNTVGWPATLEHYIAETHGMPRAIEPLQGLSGSHVYRIVFANCQRIVKYSASTQEAVFYRDIAPQLVAVGIALPYVEWQLIAQDGSWMLLEYIPHPLPAARAGGDAEVLAILHRLHHANLIVPMPSYYQPHWADIFTTTTHALLQRTTQRNYLALLQEAQAASHAVLQPNCWISGDPNPTNWGLRADQQLVLFDWERFGRGTPALDIAISIGGLPTIAQFHAAAQQYLLQDSAVHVTDPTALIRELVLAKAYTIVEFIHESTRRDAQIASVAERVLAYLPEWFDTTLQPIV